MIEVLKEQLNLLLRQKAELELAHQILIRQGQENEIEQYRVEGKITLLNQLMEHLNA